MSEKLSQCPFCDYSFRDADLRKHFDDCKSPKKKTLKFSPHLVELILSGDKTSTWRLFDDKNLTVGDMVVFIKRPELLSFALARLIEVVEKPMKDLTKYGGIY